MVGIFKENCYLVVGIGRLGDEPQWHWVDGLPEGAPIVAGPSGPRGGVSEPGSDVGKYTSIAVDTEGGIHVAYYAVDPGALHYALGQPATDGIG